MKKQSYPEQTRFPTITRGWYISFGVIAFLAFLLDVKLAFMDSGERNYEGYVLWSVLFNIWAFLNLYRYLKVPGVRARVPLLIIMAIVIVSGIADLAGLYDTSRYDMLLFGLFFAWHLARLWLAIKMLKLNSNQYMNIFAAMLILSSIFSPSVLFSYLDEDLIYMLIGTIDAAPFVALALAFLKESKLNR